MIRSTAGTRMVLVFNPRTRTVAIYTSHTDVVRLTESDTLDGGAVLPGLPVGSQNLLSEPMSKATYDRATGG